MSHWWGIKIWSVGNKQIFGHDELPFHIFSEFSFLFDNIGLMKYQINTKKTLEDKLLLHVWKVTNNNITCFFVRTNFISNPRLRFDSK